MLKDLNENASEIAGEGIIEFITDIDEAPSVEDLDGSINNLVVYDDVMLDKQKKPARIFSRGRHKHSENITVISDHFWYLSVALSDIYHVGVFMSASGKDPGWFFLII